MADYSKLPLPHKILLVWTREGSERFSKSLNGWHFDPLVIGPLLFVVLTLLVGASDPQAGYVAFAALIILSPVVLPAGLFVWFWVVWIEYIRYLFWFAQEYVLLEIQLPPEVEKNPLAMEVFFATLWNSGGETTFIQRIWKGQFRAVWSLEIASNEGRLGFYIHVRKGWRNITEARLYGQFPEAKVTEVDDYAAKIDFNLKDYDIFGSEYVKKGSSVPDALPIKTYVDFGMDKDPKEEYKIDPITNILEALGQIGKDEHFWMQIIVRARKQDEWYGFYLKHNHYTEPANAAVKAIMTAASDRARSLVAGVAPEDKAAQAQAAARGISQLTQTERTKVELIERSLSKLTFECGFRVIYLAKKDKYVGVNNGAIIRFFDTFRSDYHNALIVTRGTAYFDFPWQDFMNIRKTMEKRNLYFRYKQRAYFYVPYEQAPVFMSTEELATLWHFPASGIKTPGLNRVPSRRAEAPPNLPALPS